MAERRMFSKSIIDSDMFLDMPMTSQLLYFHLAMRADDDGFVDKPKSIMRVIGCKDDDMKVLFANNYVLPFDSKIVVIRHWRVHNYIQKDRYHETSYKFEKSLLAVSDNVYTLDTECIQDVSNMDTQVRLGECKDRIEGDKKPHGSKRFAPPSPEEVKAYCLERKNNVDPQRFIDYYTANGWKVGKNSMKDWKAAVRTWERRESDIIGTTDNTSSISADGGVHL